MGWGEGERGGGGVGGGAGEGEAQDLLDGDQRIPRVRPSIETANRTR